MRSGADSLALGGDERLAAGAVRVERLLYGIAMRIAIADSIMGCGPRSTRIRGAGDNRAAYAAWPTSSCTPLMTNWTPMQTSRNPMIRAKPFKPVAPSTRLSRDAARNTR